MSALVVASLLLAAASAQAQVFADGDGLHVLSQQQLDPRLLALTVQSDALTAPAKVRVLLPDGYDSNTSQRYPVLYLLDGTSGHASDWTTLGGAEQATAGSQLIVVMPDITNDGDGGGWCSNWFNQGNFGLPQWETYHTNELIPWIDANLRTVGSRGGRAIAGLSQGGFCSMSYAARHPDLFSTSLSFSGAPDIAYDTSAQAIITPVINYTETFLDHAPGNSIFGARSSWEINWAAHDPTTLAGNLRGMNLLLYTGNGSPGPLDNNSANLAGDGIEAGAHELTREFHARLNQLGIQSFYDDYGPGTHTWPYWARDLSESLPMVMADFANPPAPPSAVTYMSAEPSYSVYDWTVTVDRKVKEFSTLQGADSQGFTVTGSGTATVATPGFYQPGSQHQVTITTSSGTTQLVSTASTDGRLQLTVPLGPSNTVTEYQGDLPPINTKVFTTHVSAQ